MFVALPLVLYPIRATFGPWVIPTLVVTSLGCLFVLLRDPTFDRRCLGRPEAVRPGIARVLAVFAVGGVLLGLLVLGLLPERWLHLPRERPLFWLAFLFWYPLLSVYPQEIIFRAFLFHRYRTVFPSELSRVLASGMTFCLAHVFLDNWVALALTGVGGLIFAYTYARSRSLLLVAIEHALWGNLLFTIGLGHYLYGAAM